MSKNKRKQLFYTPSATEFAIDILLLLFSTGIVLIVFFAKFIKYFDVSIIFLMSWILFSYFFRRYEGKKEKIFRTNILQLTYTVICVLLVMFLLLRHTQYHLRPIVGYALMASCLLSIYYFIQRSVKKAVEYQDLPTLKPQKRNSVLLSNNTLDAKSISLLSSSIKEYSGKDAFNLIFKELDISLQNVLVSFSANYFEMKSKPDMTYQGIAILNQLNNIRGINKLLSISNHKMMIDSKIICCFEARSTKKERILAKYPWGINYLFYSFNYIIKRVIPKLPGTKKIYYGITGGKNRVLSKTEVMGRLSYCGFEIEKVEKIDNITYIVAKKIVDLEEILEGKHYGALLKLRRLGQRGEFINVYKFRTMYPYAEYIQAYVYETANLQKGGKFQDDFRISTIGRFMRRYWIDELPMLINVLKGNMKIVGVRPLSQQYYSLYSPELQKLRIRFKPGLLPPFYADMPETLDEIQESELKYIRHCFKHGVFYTDVKYFFLILNNIIFHKAKSA